MPGRTPVARFYDLGDFRKVSLLPWPGLRSLPLAIQAGTDEALLLQKPSRLHSEDACAGGGACPVASAVAPADALAALPRGLAERLRQEWPLLAAEVTAGGGAALLGRAPGEAGDAYPGIVQGGQWTKLTIYDAGRGWRDQHCSELFPRLCQMLRGQLRSDTERGRDWVKRGVITGNDELVALFGVRSAGWVPIHAGQDVRINVHLCLANCNDSKIEVAGESLIYQDGSLFAFEDRADHEILNNGKIGNRERLNLVIGVLHPDFDPDQVRHRGQLSLGWLLQQMDEGVPDRTKPQVLREALDKALEYRDGVAVEHLVSKHSVNLDETDSHGLARIHHAAAKGHADLAEFLVAQRASPSAKCSNGAQPLFYAAAMGHLSLAEFLVKHRVDVAAPASNNYTAIDIAGRRHQSDVVRFLATALQQAGHPSKEEVDIAEGARSAAQPHTRSEL